VVTLTVTVALSETPGVSAILIVKVLVPPRATHVPPPPTTKYSKVAVGSEGDKTI